MGMTYPTLSMTWTWLRAGPLPTLYLRTTLTWLKCYLQPWNKWHINLMTNNEKFGHDRLSGLPKPKRSWGDKRHDWRIRKHGSKHNYWRNTMRSKWGWIEMQRPYVFEIRSLLWWVSATRVYLRLWQLDYRPGSHCTTPFSRCTCYHCVTLFTRWKSGITLSLIFVTLSMPWHCCSFGYSLDLVPCLLPRIAWRMDQSHGRLSHGKRTRKVMGIHIDLVVVNKPS